MTSWDLPMWIDTWRRDSWSNSSTCPMIATWRRRIAQDNKNYPLGCGIRWAVDFSTMTMPEELACWRSSPVVDDTPRLVVGHLVFGVRQT